MADIIYKIKSGSVTASPEFTEASREELRVLLALIEAGGAFSSEEALANAAATSRSRCIAALALWEEAGVIEKSTTVPSITEEFEDRLEEGEIDEAPSKSVAESIRQENLASMMEECATLIGIATLPNVDVKNLTALIVQYSLSPEFVVTLAAHLASGGKKLTVRKICNEAIKLADKGCDTVEALELYIDKKEKESGEEWEIRRIFGIYGRSLSPSEKKYYKKWVEELGYGAPIITEAYDRAVMRTGKPDLAYMDAVLTSWNKAGCKTLAECIAESEAKKAEPQKDAPKPSRKTPEPPRYGDFDVNDAFKRALDRSYGTDGDTSDGEN